jgi:hypothetical protein
MEVALSFGHEEPIVPLAYVVERLLEDDGERMVFAAGGSGERAGGDELLA